MKTPRLLWRQNSEGKQEGVPAGDESLRDLGRKSQILAGKEGCRSQDEEWRFKPHLSAVRPSSNLHLTALAVSPLTALSPAA
jgi:hypothetical protein